MKIIRIIFSILISILCLYFATRNVQWGELKEILSQAKLTPILLSVLISTLGFTTRAIRWQMILQPFQKISFFPLLRWQIGGLLINNLLPLRMGEFARAYWTGHKSFIPKSSVLATIFLERILDIGSIAGIALLILTVLGIGGPLLTPLNLLVAGGSLLILLCAGKTYFGKFPQLSLKQKIENLLPVKLKGFVEHFGSGLKVVKDKNEVIKLISISIVTWCIDITTIYIMAHALNVPIHWLGAGFTVVGLVLGVMVPAAPGAAGTYEAGGVIALSILGTDKTLALSFILLIHAVQYIFVLLTGVPILICEGFSPKKILEEDSSN